MNWLITHRWGLALGVAVGIGLWGGWLINGWRSGAALAACETRQAQFIADLQDKATRASEAARAAEQRGAKLAAQVALAETANRQLAQEKTDVIQKLATGRRCLDAGLVGVLNAASRDGQRAVPAPPAEPADAAARFATDTDVGQWIAAAQGHYAACRARLAAIAEFERGRLNQE